MTRVLAGANLALRFLLELCGIVAAAWWGFQLGADGPMRYLLAILAAAVVIVFWALVVAPKASNPIPPLPRVLIGSSVLLLTAIGLWATGQPVLAAEFAILIVLNTVVMLATG